jgi:hypothetical protein
LREKPVAELASDLGVSETCLRNWVAQADRDEGRRSDGLTTPEREELVRLRRELSVTKLEVEILKRAAACPGERPPKMISTFITERCSDLRVSTCSRVLGVSTSGHYQRRREPVTDAELVEAYRANIVFDIWKGSRHSYGMPRIRREFRLGRPEGISRPTTGARGDGGVVGASPRRDLRGGLRRRDRGQGP